MQILKFIIGTISLFLFFIMGFFVLQLVFLILAIIFLPVSFFIILPVVLIYDFVFTGFKVLPIFTISFLVLILIFSLIKHHIRNIRNKNDIF